MSALKEALLSNTAFTAEKFLTYYLFQNFSPEINQTKPNQDGIFLSAYSAIILARENLHKYFKEEEFGICTPKIQLRESLAFYFTPNPPLLLNPLSAVTFLGFHKECIINYYF